MHALLIFLRTEVVDLDGSVGNVVAIYIYFFSFHGVGEELGRAADVFRRLSKSIQTRDISDFLLQCDYLTSQQQYLHMFWTVFYLMTIKRSFISFST